MRRKLTITVDEQVYVGLHRIIGRRRVSGFIESLVKPHVVREDMARAYRHMAQDEESGAEALAWVEAAVEDVADEPR